VIIFQLVIPEELGTLSLEAGTRGWFKGSVIGKEYLGVVYASRVGAGEHLYAPGSSRLFDHWAFFHGSTQDQLAPWFAVKPGFGKALAASRKRVGRELASWISDGEPLGLPEGQPASICCFEPVEGGDADVYLILVGLEDKIFKGVVHKVGAQPRPPARLDGLRPMKALAEKRVAVVGVGSGGSMVALDLAASGVGTLHLFDKDDLTLDNLFRHVCDLRHLGRAKVLAVRDLIRSYNLPAVVEPHEQDVVDDAQDLWKVMDEVDLVICATDSVSSRRLVNYVCVQSETPLVMACTFRNARIGELIRVLPSESACYECTRIALREAGALEPVETGDGAAAASLPYSLSEGDEEEGRGANQGTRSDVAMVAVLQSRIAIMTLLAGDPDVDMLPRDYMTWGGRVETGLVDPFNFERPFSVNWLLLTRREDCPVCAAVGKTPDPKLNEQYESIMANLNTEASPS
jgi:molybdopterin/thiamine biosynthesis adenylyltransferase